MDKKNHKPDKREYTLKIIPHQGETIRSIRLPIHTIKYGIVSFCVGVTLFIATFAYSTYSMSMLQKDQAELEDLRQANMIQQTQILQLAQKANVLQEDMDKLNELEAEIRQIAAIDGNTPSKNTAVEAVHEGQGGPGIHPNIQILNEALDTIDLNMQNRKRDLEQLKNIVTDKKAQMAITPSIWPTRGDVSSRYGLRWNGSDFHPGIDIANDEGTAVVATADGVVAESGWNSGGYGYLVDIEHGNGVITRYAHNSHLLVSAGTTVKKGQTIAYMGNTGFSTGPHVHYEVIVNGKSVNPNNFLKN